jgi:hypothetical protein
MSGVTPVLRDDQSMRIAEGLRGTDESPNARPLRNVLEDRRALTSIEAEARLRGEFDRADTARRLRSSINADIRSSVDRSPALREADTNYRERFAPYFRSGNVSPEFFEGIDRDPQRFQNVPEATADRFLTAGPTSRAAAADLARILEIAPNADDALSAATEYVIADAVGNGIIRDGVVTSHEVSAISSWGRRSKITLINHLAPASRKAMFQPPGSESAVCSDGRFRERTRLANAPQFVGWGPNLPFAFRCVRPLQQPNSCPSAAGHLDQ